MDQKGDQFQTLGICYRLYNFITKALAKHALKTVTLGLPLHKNLAKLQNRVQEETLCDKIKNTDPFVPNSSSTDGLKKDHKELPQVQENDTNFNGGEKIETHVSQEQEAPLPLLEAKPPTKVVSINERLEEIDTSKKKIKRKKSKEKLASFEKEEDEPKPLRSILKVGSTSGEKSNSFVNRASDG